MKETCIDFIAINDVGLAWSIEFHLICDIKRTPDKTRVSEKISNIYFLWCSTVHELLFSKLDSRKASRTTVIY